MKKSKAQEMQALRDEHAKQLAEQKSKLEEAEKRNKEAQIRQTQSEKKSADLEAQVKTLEGVIDKERQSKETVSGFNDRQPVRYMQQYSNGL
jgi:predicted phage gp36 major capsid-like protein